MAVVADGVGSPLSHLVGTSNLLGDDARCGGEFRTTFRTIPGPRSSVDRATVS